MPSINIQLPNIEADHTVEILVRVNGVQRQYQYRVEVFPWEDCEPSTANRVECIRRMIDHYDPGFQLLQIGSATDKYVQVTFQQVGPPVPVQPAATA